MVTSIKSFLQSNKYEFIANNEENLEKGKIYFFSGSAERTNFSNGGFCWQSPGTGQVIVDVWGAGGSGARMCCCGFGIPGNPGAFARKCLCIQSGCWICGYTGMSCGSPDLCFRGCSEYSGVCWQANGANGCVCAQGGRGGTSICSSSASAYCCFTANSFCTTLINANCGVVCNYGSGTGSCCAQAYGGDINCYGGFSCANFGGCQPSCPCSTSYMIATPPYYYSTCGGVITYGNESDNGGANWTGMSLNGYIHGMGVMGKNPSHGSPTDQNCWTGGRTCGCYEGQGCIPFVPPGFPGSPPNPCPDHRDMAFRGGHGAVRIKFILQGS
jgi:hypothetical protein